MHMATFAFAIKKAPIASAVLLGEVKGKAAAAGAISSATMTI
jgi:hypothetical protein